MSSSSTYSGSNASDTASKVADGVDRSLSTGAETARSAMKSIASTAKDVSEKAVAARDAVSNFIETRPLTAVVIALGVGVLFSRGLMRR